MDTSGLSLGELLLPYPEPMVRRVEVEERPPLVR
jgi:hypothetical protein